MKASNEPDFPVQVLVRSVGLQMGWLSAETDKAEIDITSGAGTGSKWIRIAVKDKATGDYREWGIDMSVLANTVLEAVGYGDES